MSELAAAAVDLGASGGRVLRGHLGPDRLAAEVVHRFPNTPRTVGGSLCWDVEALWDGICSGLRAAGPVESVGVDSWAVDYGLLDGDGEPLAPPAHYRDGRTDGVLERVRAQLGEELLYDVTGLQFLPFNTVYQLLAEPAERLERAAQLLLIPDLVCHRLTGIAAAERTNASTTGLYDVRAGDWSDALLARLGLPRRILAPVRDPAQPLGPLRAELRAALDAPAPVVTTVASHDTASAVAAVPATDDRFAFISCGTWSLVGVELDRPVLTAASRAANFTNEVGVDGTIRYLRNVAGLWLLQESLRSWHAAGVGVTLEAVLAGAAAEPALRSVVDAESEEFLAPGDMPTRVRAACRRGGQPEPVTPAAVTRCILDSLAVAHAKAVANAARLSGRTVDVVHLVGGGARNGLLCQLTADACGLPVVAGPVEATALGNLGVQARAHGVLPDRWAVRELVRRTQPLRRYEPTDHDRWSPWLATGAVAG